MKLFLAAALISAVLFSCGTFPSSGGQDTAFPPPLTEPAAGDSLPAVELPPAEDAPEEPPPEPPEPAVLDPPLPEPEFAEVITFFDPPAEEPSDQDYPEPELPAAPPPELAQLPEEPPPEPPPETEPLPEPELSATPPPELAQLPEESPPETEPSPEPELSAAPPPDLAQVPEEPPPEPPPPPPAPPPFIRPAETAAVRPPPREALPVPVNPPPEAPARRPPVAVSPALPNPPLSASDQPRPAASPVPVSPETGDNISYSRTVRGTAGQLLEVPFRGTGWVYLGETDARPGIPYITRRTDPEGQTFVFRLDGSGEYTLLFYKQDFIRDYILNDQVRVIVEDAPEQASPYAGEPARLTAEPRWPPPENPVVRTDSGASPEAATAVAQGAVSAGTAASAAEDSVSPGTAVAAAQGNTPAGGAASELLPAALLERAREAYGAGQFPEALAALEEFQSKFPLGSDEAWWLYGQLLEAAGPKRDIRGALEYYRRLIREYPQSPRCDDARKRIAYLERFYFNIR